MPIYRVELEGDSIVFGNRETMNEARATHDWPALDPETYHEARIAAPSYDVHFLERDWMEFWVDSAKLELRNPDKAFVAFCRRRHERSPDP